MDKVVQIQNLIYEIRGVKVMLDSDLAKLYEIPTHRLNEAVKRNITRFPSNFMFQLSKDEYDDLISQIAISKSGRGGRRFIHYTVTQNKNLRSQIAISSRQHRICKHCVYKMAA